MSKTVKKTACDLKNRFYVAADRVSERNDYWVRKTLDEAIDHGQRILANEPNRNHVYIVKIIAKVELVVSPVQVSLFE